MNTIDYKQELATLVNNHEIRHVEYKNMLENLHKTKKEYNPEDFEYLSALIREYKNENEKCMKELRKEVEHFNQGLNPTSCYK